MKCEPTSIFPDELVLGAAATVNSAPLPFSSFSLLLLGGDLVLGNIVYYKSLYPLDFNRLVLKKEDRAVIQ